MGRFQGVAQAIADRIRKGPVTAEELPSIIEETSGRECPPFNCYPGTGTPGCEYLAVFISLICKTYALGLGHLGFRKAIDLIVKHMFKYCQRSTWEFLFITDSWDPEYIRENLANLKEIQRQGLLEIYLIDGLGNVCEKFI
jgi:hypothetical protein